MLCGSLDGRGVWGRMDTCICMPESLLCSPEAITTLLTGYTPIKKKLKKERAKKVSVSPVFKIVGKGPFPRGRYFQVTEVYPFAKLKDTRTAKDMLILFAYVLPGIKNKDL